VLADQPVLGEQRPCPADLVGAQPLQGMGRLGPAGAAGGLGLGSYGHVGIVAHHHLRRAARKLR